MGFLQIDHKAHCLSFEHQQLKLDINNRESKKIYKFVEAEQVTTESKFELTEIKKKINIFFL